jgi:hypothetical protein
MHRVEQVTTIIVSARDTEDAEDVAVAALSTATTVVLGIVSVERCADGRYRVTARAKNLAPPA